jgi:hypothetical protein
VCVRACMCVERGWQKWGSRRCSWGDGVQSWRGESGINRKQNLEQRLRRQVAVQQAHRSFGWLVGQLVGQKHANREMGEMGP